MSALRDSVRKYLQKRKSTKAAKAAEKAKNTLVGYWVPKKDTYFQFYTENGPLEFAYECKTDEECPHYAYCLQNGCGNEFDDDTEWQSKKFCTVLVNADRTPNSKRRSLHKKLNETHGNRYKFIFADKKYKDFSSLKRSAMEDYSNDNPEELLYRNITKSDGKASLKKCKQMLRRSGRR